VLTRFVALGSALLYLPVYALWLPKGLAEASATQLITQALYQGIGPTIIAMWLFLLAVQQLGAARTGALIGLVPVLAGLAAVPLLGEPLTASLLLGLCAVSAGAWYAARPGRVA
jgi:drug/metabolite transporter (DMT)-like permease